MNTSSAVRPGWFTRATAAPTSLLRWRARDRWLEGLMRFGQLARGFVYLIPGAYALRLAIGSSGAGIGQKRAIATLEHQPLGGVLVVLLAVGLAGYSLWGFHRAIFDPLGRGRSVGGWLTRLGYLGSGIAYAGLLWFTIQLVLGAPSSDDSTSRWIARALTHRHGSWAVIGVGLVWIGGAALAQLWMALRGTFMRDLDLVRMGPREHAWARQLGRIGLASRAIVFLVIGVSIVGAGLHLDPGESQELGGALLHLLREPFGRPLLTTVASGLIVFGVYSILCARWARLRAAVRPLRAGETNAW
jgi:Domain of Unknown Function (DUF1206)